MASSTIERFFITPRLSSTSNIITIDIAIGHYRPATANNNQQHRHTRPTDHADNKARVGSIRRRAPARPAGIDNWLPSPTEYHHAGHVPSCLRSRYSLKPAAKFSSSSWLFFILS